ncbi:hypothetical protein L3Q82_011327 [Scortum barcoo]|uniref:Uncharacterized protein n=1 Tax=Scortum barcoo TaxID=214431 RepID=A0ACB8W9W0_9TELE|nr:hypothetical protein L3Q82_011327 [Scortum barcoo]
MEEDYQSASKRFWQTVRRLRRGKQYSANTVYSAGGELLTSTGDIVDSSITQAEVTEVVRKLLGGKAPGVDEIRPEYLKSLDVVGLSWLTRLLQHCMEVGDIASGVENWGGGPSFFLKRGTGECVPTTGGSHFSASPGKSTPGYWRIRPIVDPRIQEELCGFRPGRGTLDQLYTLHRVLEGLWEFAQPVHMCFVDLEKAFDRVPHDDVVLLASSGQDLQHVLERFAAECEAAGMRISTSKSEAIVLGRKRVVCPLLGGWRGPASSGGVQVSQGLVHE